MIRFLALLLALALPCHADLRTVEVDFVFRQQRNPGYFGLALPIPGHLFVQYDDEAVDEDPGPDGVYETEGAYGALSFGTGIGFHFIPFVNTQVHIWVSPFQAVSFGNDDALSAYGLYIESYRIYALFADYFFPIPGWDGSLHWLADMAGDSRFHATYVFFQGHTETPAWTETLLQTGSDTQTYHIQ